MNSNNINEKLSRRISTPIGNINNNNNSNNFNNNKLTSNNSNNNNNNNNTNNSKRRLSTVIKSVASNSGVGHLVGIAEQSGRKPMKEQLTDLKQEINDLGLGHLIENISGLGMQSELKMLKNILEQHRNQNIIHEESNEEDNNNDDNPDNKNEKEIETKDIKDIQNNPDNNNNNKDNNKNSNNNNQTIKLNEEIKNDKNIIETSNESDDLKNSNVSLIPRRGSFAKQLVNKAQTIGIQTSDESSSQPLVKTNSKRRLSTVIKSVASNSGVGHLVGIAEQSGRKPMKEQLSDLKQEINDLGLNHLINESHKTMSMSAEIKALKKILYDYKVANDLYVEPIEEPVVPNSPEETYTPIPRRGSFAKQLVNKAQTIGIHSDESHSPTSTSPQTNSKRRLSTVIKSVASNSGVGHLVGIAEQSGRKPMKEQLSDLKQEINDLGLNHLINESHKTMSMSAEIKALKKIIEDYYNENKGENNNQNNKSTSELITPSTASSTVSRTPFAKSQLHLFASFDDNSNDSYDQDEVLQEKDNEIQNLKNSINEMNEIIQLQKDELIRLQTENDENTHLLNMQSELLKEQNNKSSSQPSDLVKMKMIIELKEKFCQELELQNQQIQTELIEIKNKQIQSILFSNTSTTPINNITNTSTPPNNNNDNNNNNNNNNNDNNDNNTKKLDDENIKQLQIQLQDYQKMIESSLNEIQQKDLQLNESNKIIIEKSNQLEEISSNASALIEEMQRQILEKETQDNFIIQLQQQLNDKQSIIDTLNHDNVINKTTLNNQILQINELEKQQIQYNITIQSLQDQINLLENDKKILMESIQSTLSQKAEVSANSSSLVEELQLHIQDKQVKDQEISKLNLKLIELQSNIDIKINEINDYTNQIKILKLQNDEIISLNNLNNDKLNQQELLILTLTNNIENSQEIIKNKEEEISKQNIDYQNKMSELQTSLLDITSKYELLQKDYNEIKTKEVKLLKDINELNELLEEQNEFLKDAANSCNDAEEEIEEFEKELISALSENKILKSDINTLTEEKKNLQLKLTTIESRLITLQKEKNSLQEFIQTKLQLNEDSSVLTLVPENNSNLNQSHISLVKNLLNTTLYSDYNKNSIPLTAYIQLQKDNQVLLKNIVSQNKKVNDLIEILKTTFKSKEKLYTQYQHKDFNIEKVTEQSDKAWLEMNQIPVFSGYSYYCQNISTDNYVGGNLFDKVYTKPTLTSKLPVSIPVPIQSLSSSVSTSSKQNINQQSSTDFQIEIQTPIIPLTIAEEYLQDSIRRLRIGWILIKITNYERREIILHFDIQQKLLKFTTLRMERDFQSILNDTEVYLSMISSIKKHDELNKSSDVESYLSMSCKSGDDIILKFVAIEERDIFYDSFLCIICHIDPIFSQKSILNFVSHEDIPTSKYLKGNLVKKPNGEYMMLSFNRKNLLRHQSSIATLQNVGLFSQSESKITEFLDLQKKNKTSTNDHIIRALTRNLSNDEDTMMLEKVISPTSLVTSTQSSSSFVSISGTSDINVIPTQEVINETKSDNSSYQQAIKASFQGLFGGSNSLFIKTNFDNNNNNNNNSSNNNSSNNNSIKDISNHATTPTSTASNNHINDNNNDNNNNNNLNNDEDDNNPDNNLDDLGSIYRSNNEERVQRKSFFKSQQPTQRHTFSHENPISIDPEKRHININDIKLMKSQSGGSNESPKNFFQTLPQVTARKSINLENLPLKSSQKDEIISQSSVSVGAENASRFMKRRSVAVIENRKSAPILKSDYNNNNNDNDKDNNILSSHNLKNRSTFSSINTSPRSHSHSNSSFTFNNNYINNKLNTSNTLQSIPSSNSLASSIIEGDDNMNQNYIDETSSVLSGDSIMTNDTRVSKISLNSVDNRSEKLRRRGSASALLAQQTAQFRKKVTERSATILEQE